MKAEKFFPKTKVRLLQTAFRTPPIQMQLTGARPAKNIRAMSVTLLKLSVKMVTVLLLVLVMSRTHTMTVHSAKNIWKAVRVMQNLRS